MLLTWNERYRVGHDLIDRQHQRVFELVNDLERLIAIRAERTDLLDTIHALIDHALSHFSDEEALMQQIDFEGLTRHRWLHSEFAGKIADMALKWGEGQEVTAEQLRDILTEWLLDHILTEDMQIGAAVQSKQTPVT
jgi:hemerythrin